MHVQILALHQVLLVIPMAAADVLKVKNFLKIKKNVFLSATYLYMTCLMENVFQNVRMEKNVITRVTVSIFVNLVKYVSMEYVKM
jgi:hypothetical protein